MALMPWWSLLPAAVAISHLVPVATSGADNTVVAPSPPLTAPAPADCPSKCGDVAIPYPFGIGGNCSWRGTYVVTCDHNFEPPRPYLGSNEVLDISLEAGEIRFLVSASYQCYIPFNETSGATVSLNNTFTVSGLVISTTRNEFTATGCDTLALLRSSSYYTGCITSCESLEAAARDGDKCTGLGCCQMSIPGNLTDITVAWNLDRKTTNNRAWRYSPCSYAFVAEKGWYHFEQEDLVRTQGLAKKFGNRTVTQQVPLVLEWAIWNDGQCSSPTEKDGVLEEPRGSACVSANSYCVNALTGYLCNCSKGYSGNPYVAGGCENINECMLRKSDPTRYEKQYPCSSGSTCYDTPGDYECKCNFGRRGDGKSATGCQPIFPGYATAVVATIVAVILACLATILLQTQKQRKCFNDNGGKILQAQGITIYTKREVEKITQRFSKRLGEGYFGNVYEGIINSTQVQRVAVKRAKAKKVALWQKMTGHESRQKGHEDDDGSFVNEIIFQSKVRPHANVVQLLGCCLETEIPILVLEYVSSGSLEHMLHGENKCSLSLPKRLDIAIGSAEGLFHMHSHGDYKHVHGDVKPGNILLDGDLKPKVSDFGSSKLLSINNYAMCVAADWDYLDPVYRDTGHFTVKSDVYSFGFVLLELITRRKARYGDNNNLANDFRKSCKDEGSGRKMYDVDILSGDDAQQSKVHIVCLDRIGTLALQCLKLEDVEERPTMAEVVEELKQVKVIACGVSCSEAC